MDLYHVYNRGNNKQLIFLNNNDRMRFLFTILFFQSPKSFTNPNEHIIRYKKTGKFLSNRFKQNTLLQNRYVTLLNFVFMPNHFHLTIREELEGGRIKYLQRIQNSYTKYFNTVHCRVGHLFQGRYKSKIINDDGYLLKLSAYVHSNPREISGVDEELYTWSSYRDYLNENRWGSLLNTDLILSRFDNSQDYCEAVRSTVPSKSFDIM